MGTSQPASQPAEPPLATRDVYFLIILMDKNYGFGGAFGAVRRCFGDGEGEGEGVRSKGEPPTPPPLALYRLTRSFHPSLLSLQIPGLSTTPNCRVWKEIVMGASCNVVVCCVLSVAVCVWPWL